jgi:hypothetical protein
MAHNMSKKYLRMSKLGFVADNLNLFDAVDESAASPNWRRDDVVGLLRPSPNLTGVPLFLRRLLSAEAEEGVVVEADLGPM